MSRIFEALQHSSQTSGESDYARHFMTFYDFANDSDPAEPILTTTPKSEQVRTVLKVDAPSVFIESLSDNAVLDLEFEEGTGQQGIITRNVAELISDDLLADELLQSPASFAVAAPAGFVAPETFSESATDSIANYSRVEAVSEMESHAEFMAASSPVHPSLPLPARADERTDESILEVTENEQSTETVPDRKCEEFRALREALINLDRVTPLQTVLICSVNAGDGASFVARNLSECMAEIPSLNVGRFQINAAKTASLPPVSGIRYSLSLQRTSITGLREITIAQPGTSLPDLMQNCNIQAMLDTLRNRFDLILIDAPSINDCPETIRLAAMVDGVILVAQHHATRLTILQQARERLVTAGARLLGVVLNRG
jgi:Mrp family chromosome partitioning ATPase